MSPTAWSCNCEINDLEGAAREFRTALRLNAQSLQPTPTVTYNSYIGLGQVALLQGREPEALDYFNQAVHLLPDSDFAYDVLGSVYFPRGDYARAAEYFQQAVRVNPQDTGGAILPGNLLDENGQAGAGGGTIPCGARSGSRLFPGLFGRGGGTGGGGR